MFIAPNSEPRNFAFVTQEFLYQRLVVSNQCSCLPNDRGFIIFFYQNEGLNAVLQQTKTAPTDDGSLSVYAYMQNKPYVNIEAAAADVCIMFCAPTCAITKALIHMFSFINRIARVEESFCNWICSTEWKSNQRSITSVSLYHFSNSMGGPPFLTLIFTLSRVFMCVGVFLIYQSVRSLRKASKKTNLQSGIYEIKNCFHLSLSTSKAMCVRDW